MFRKKKAVPQFEIADSTAMRGLVQRLSLGVHNRPMRIIVFISARPREGTSTMARNYAIALASQSSQKVLLIDANPYAEERFRTFGAEASAGVVEPTTPAEASGENTKPLDPNVSIGQWTGGDTNPGASTRLIHRSDFWKDLLNSYDSLIIDAPSLRASFDGVAVAAKADGTVIVVEAEKTPMPVIGHLRDTLTTAGAKTMGVVMNKRRYYIPSRVYKKL